MDDIPAGTGDGGLKIFRVNLLFQNFLLLYLVAADLSLRYILRLNFRLI